MHRHHPKNGASDCTPANPALFCLISCREILHDQKRPSAASEQSDGVCHRNAATPRPAEHWASSTKLQETELISRTGPGPSASPAGRDHAKRMASINHARKVAAPLRRELGAAGSDLLPARRVLGLGVSRLELDPRSTAYGLRAHIGIRPERKARGRSPFGFRLASSWSHFN